MNWRGSCAGLGGVLAALLGSACKEDVVLAGDNCPSPGEIQVTEHPDNLLRVLVTAPEATVAGARFRVWESGEDPDAGWDVPADEYGAAVVWGLRFEAAFRVRVDVPAPDGTLTPGEDVACFTVGEQPGIFPRGTARGSSTLPFTLVNLMKRGTTDELLLIVDRRGRIRWYEDPLNLPGDLGGKFDGYTWDPETRTIWSLVGHKALVQYALDGTVVRLWEPGVLQSLASHDVLPLGDRVYVPVTEGRTADDGTLILHDGYEVYSESGERLHSWFLSDHGLSLEDDPPPEAIYSENYWSNEFGYEALDWSHVNSVEVTGEGDDEVVYLSLRNLSQVVAVDAPTGEIRWRLGDNGAGAVNSAGDFALASDSEAAGWWSYQHEFVSRPDGGFQIFDNRDDGEHSRALGFTLDESTRTLQYDTVIELGHACTRSRGASYALPGGNVVTSCGSHAEVQEFSPDGEELWSVRFDCGTHAKDCVIYRGIPVEGW